MWSVRRPSSHVGSGLSRSVQAARSASIVRSPDGSTSTTMVPVRPTQRTATSAPTASSCSVSQRPVGSLPTCPMNRARARARHAASTTLAALPPRRRVTTDRVSLAGVHRLEQMHDHVLDQIAHRAQHGIHSARIERGHVPLAA